jgi:hypothetical protein
MHTRKKLIEVALPLEKINAASAREKSIRHGHPSTLHLWWARRPLAAARAVIFAQMVDDPSAHPETFPTRMCTRLRQRGAAETAAELRRHPAPLRLSLLATVCWQRQGEIIDSLADLLIGLIHRIYVRAYDIQWLRLYCP